MPRPRDRAHPWWLDIAAGFRLGVVIGLLTRLAWTTIGHLL